MPAEARQTMPALPAACTHAGAPDAPLHRSVVQTLPSSVHAVPLALTASAGHAAEAPVQLSATSHSLAAARQTVAADAKPSAGQVADAPVQVSATSHTPAEGRHTAP